MTEVLEHFGHLAANPNREYACNNGTKGPTASKLSLVDRAHGKLQGIVTDRNQCFFSVSEGFPSRVCLVLYCRLGVVERLPKRLLHE